MNVGMKLRNIHTGDEVVIVETYMLDNATATNSKLSRVVYILENEKGERENWNAFYMNRWEIVKRKILFNTEEEMLNHITGEE